MRQILYTVGHSTRSIDEFLSLLTIHAIDTLYDVRSTPYSKYNPQFDRETLSEQLRRHGLQYSYLGDELGGRPNDGHCYINGQVQYDLVTETNPFKKGIELLLDSIKSHRIAMMCSEKDPTNCHRMLLVARHLRNSNLDITHIVDCEISETQLQVEKRLLKLSGLPEVDMFSSFDELVGEAYEKQAKRVGYAKDRSLTRVGYNEE